MPRIAPSLTKASEIPVRIITAMIANTNPFFNFSALPVRIYAMNYNSKEAVSIRPPYFPMMIDIEGRRVLIVGGGHVASRRAGTLLRCGAEIVAVSPEFAPRFPEGTRRITRKFSPDDITPEYSLVIAATNDRTVNHLVRVMAVCAGIPVNVADCQEECDFFFPSMISEGSVSASVCSAGASPSLTHRLSERLRRVWPIWITQENDRKTR